MTNDRIQQYLALHTAQRMCRRTPTILEAGADEIVRWMAAPHGPLELADQAAIERLSAECVHVVDPATGKRWWEVTPTQPGLVLDELAVEADRYVRSAVLYLASRGLLHAHPKNAHLVRTDNAPF